jgi:hypothetical protein
MKVARFSGIARERSGIGWRALFKGRWYASAREPGFDGNPGYGHPAGVKFLIVNGLSEGQAGSPLACSVAGSTSGEARFGIGEINDTEFGWEHRL